MLLLISTGLWLAPFQELLAQERPRVEVPRGEEKLVVVADTIETKGSETLLARGNVVATYADATLKASSLTYTLDSGQVVIEGNIEVFRATQWLKGTKAELNLEQDTGIIYDVSGFTDDIYINATKLVKTGPDAYVAEDGFLTSCEETVPNWSFRIKKARIRPQGTAKLAHTFFRVKKIPFFYFPYLVLPTGRKERSSGFLLPSTGTSNNKGRRISQSFFLVLGQSADLMYQGDYFSERGFGHRFTLRARPDEVTTLDLNGFFVDDRKGDGGASLVGFAQTRFGQGFRGVADFNLVSNFRFRQAFSDNFFTATRPNESSRLFVTNNFQSKSLNLLVSREETRFPGRTVVTQVTPGMQFKLTGQRIPSTSLYLDLDSSVEGLSRADALIETPRISQRLDLFPRVYFSLPLFQGLRITPRIGLRETFYSDSLSRTEGDLRVSGDSVHREYLDFSLDLKGWGLSRIFGSESGRQWKHLIEPVVRYQLIDGIDHFDRIIRVDERDAIADTNEIEYSLYNRFFFKNSAQSGLQEWLSVKISQKFFLEPSFGGAFRAGSINQFFPLNSLSGIPYATAERDFSPVTAVVRFNPSRRYSFDLRGDFDTDSGQFRDFSVTGFMNRRFLSLATTYYVTSQLLEDFEKQNQIQGSIGLGNVRRGISSVAGFSYDAQASRFLNHLVRLGYFWDCCGISAEVFGFNLGTRQERQLRFSFFLKGIGSFGTIRQPDNVF